MISDQAEPPAGTGIARTGVTILDPGGDLWASPIPAGVSILNGAGELTGRTQVDEWGLAETPVFLTSTMQVGRVYDAACRLLIDEQPRIGIDDVVIPLVGECDDSWLTDTRRMHVQYDDVALALAEARRSGGGDGSTRPDPRAIASSSSRTSTPSRSASPPHRSTHRATGVPMLRRIRRRASTAWMLSARPSSCRPGARASGW